MASIAHHIKLNAHNTRTLWNIRHPITPDPTAGQLAPSQSLATNCPADVRSADGGLEKRNSADATRHLT